MDAPDAQREQTVETPDTEHEAHEHASRRVILGVVAVAFVFIVGGLIWSRWGDAIEEFCFGDGDACEVEILPASSDGDAQFETPDTYQF